MSHVSRRGFTLIELLVVVGMIVLLATILLPMISKVHSQARRTATAADLMTISEALEAYKGDFGDYPRLDHRDHLGLPRVIGAPLLCWALVAPGPALSTPIGPGGLSSPGDGADGPGFRLRGTTGPVKGPYLPPDRFLIGTIDWVGLVHQPGLVTSIQSANFDNAEDVLADRFNSPILYFAATRGAVATSSPSGFVKSPFPSLYVTPPPTNPAVFYFEDNQIFLDLAAEPAGGSPGHPGGNPANLTRGANGWKVMSYRLGDINYNGVIDPGEVPITTGPYLLWSAGNDTLFGNDDDVMCDGTQLQQVNGPLPFQIAPK
ncbi:MAG TPA: prepilin-type N-terminal cleavage/methylation domain-containing protein [Tepidisphaeraceae bacterium]|jgi:prepilin-type N-terminal cleavage/methylation domain-containing protein|nr:prepilin-type N-terminal cleavage/methylation domain-containing protein [Tepidisphaeraceae bacterium]